MAAAPPQRIMVLDTETTGLPATTNGQFPSPKNTQYYAFARVIEIGYIIYEEDRDGEPNIIKEASFLIKPDGFNVEATHVHGITHEHALKHGRNRTDVMKEFYDDLKTVDMIVAHNIEFDKNVLLAECHLAKEQHVIDEMERKKHVCTKEMSKAMWLKTGMATSENGPKLIDLYKWLFAENVIQDHRALSDVRLCARCYFFLAR